MTPHRRLRPSRPAPPGRAAAALLSVAALAALGSACGGGGSPSPAASTASRSDCTGAALNLAVDGPVATGAGGATLQVVLTDTFGPRCTMTGYPTVVLQAASGGTVGPPLAHTPGATHTVTLARDTSVVSTVDLRPPTGPGCVATPADGIEVSPPGATSARILERLDQPVTACVVAAGRSSGARAAASRAIGTVTAVRPAPAAGVPAS